jgi:hypothetical protein
MDLGVPSWISEFGTGFGSSQTNFGVQKRIWELPIDFQSQKTDSGVPMRFSLAFRMFFSAFCVPSVVP